MFHSEREKYVTSKRAETCSGTWSSSKWLEELVRAGGTDETRKVGIAQILQGVMRMQSIFISRAVGAFSAVSLGA